MLESMEIVSGETESFGATSKLINALEDWMDCESRYEMDEGSWTTELAMEGET